MTAPALSERLRSTLVRSRDLWPAREDYRLLPHTWRKDLIAGVTVGIVALPLALEYPFWSEKRPEALACFGPLLDGRDGGDAVLRVRDDGIGMTPQVLARAFELFEQGDQELHRAQGGLGIGLTLTRRLLEMHGGSIAAASDGPGRGSAFTVRLPLEIVASVSRTTLQMQAA